MKPHIRRRFGIWYCGRTNGWWGIFPPYGHGYTPSEAFRDWKAQTEVEASTATTLKGKRA